MTNYAKREKLSNMAIGDRMFIVNSHCKLFKTYIYCGDEYFGHTVASNDYEIYSFETTNTPEIACPVEVELCGSFTNNHIDDDKCYVFNEVGNTKCLYFIMSRQPDSFNVTNIMYVDQMFASSDYVKIVDLNDVYFSKDECIAWCRDRYNHRNEHSVDSMNALKSTLDNMQKRLDEFMKSELFVDHCKEISADLNEP